MILPWSSWLFIGVFVINQWIVHLWFVNFSVWFILQKKFNFNKREWLGSCLNLLKNMSKYYFPNLKNNQKSKIFIKSVSWQFCNMQLKTSKAILQLNLFSVKYLFKQFIMINKRQQKFSSEKWIIYESITALHKLINKW